MRISEESKAVGAIGVFGVFVALALYPLIIGVGIGFIVYKANQHYGRKNDAPKDDGDF